MGTFFTLVNYTKKECISFTHLPTNKAREIAGNPASAAITVWYMLKNIGDRISFVGNEDDDVLSNEYHKHSEVYTEVTEKYLNELLANEILRDCGFLFQCEDQPETKIRDIRNAWMLKELL